MISKYFTLHIFILFDIILHMKKILCVMLLNVNFLYSTNEHVSAKIKNWLEEQCSDEIGASKIMLYARDHPAENLKQYYIQVETGRCNFIFRRYNPSDYNMTNRVVGVVMSVFPIAGRLLKPFEKYKGLMSSVLDDEGCLTILCKNTNFPELNHIALELIIPNK